MEYNFSAIEQKWQEQWEAQKAYVAPNRSSKPKYYVLDMFPYPSGAGLHVGHPLGYIASDIFARYKRNRGFNVLHPMGYDAFGLPAEQYAIEHGVHPAVSTAKNIETFRKQLDKIGFSFDWSREVNTSKPGYYKWTQWIFLQLFESWYNRRNGRTEPVKTLINIFEAEGNAKHPIPNASFQIPAANRQPSTVNTFSADEWNSFDEKTKQAILMEYRVAYCGYGEVNWCEALGTVLANDEVVNGVSERGGYPVEKKRLRQWYLRITEYADRLLQGLQTVDFSDAMKEMQSNWIGKSTGAEIEFDLTPQPPLQQVGAGERDFQVSEPFPKYGVKDRVQFENAKRNRKNSTEAELVLWEQLRNNKTGFEFRRQHPVDGFIADFACLQKGLIVEVDGGYHTTDEQQAYDEERTKLLEAKGFTILRFTNEEVKSNVYAVRDKIKAFLSDNTSSPKNVLNEDAARYETSQQNTAVNDLPPLSSSAGEGPGVRCYTTRPDTIFGVDFLVIAPEHELVEKITSPEQKAAVDEYIAYVKSRSERERMAEKKITGVATGAYAVNPFDGRQVPVWISEYVLAGYGTGAIMAVPCGDERDHKFAEHFGIPITNIIGDAYNGEEANPTKDAVLSNSGFLNGTVMRDAIEVVVLRLEELGIGKRKTNYKMRDAAFSRQRYWGEPFPIKWTSGVAYPLSEEDLPLELPHVDSYGPGPDGEGPLANMDSWKYQEVKLVQSGTASLPLPGEGALETNTMPGYAGSSWYFLRYMDPDNDAAFCDKTISDYWNQVDLYVGGTEHAVGHLLYSRMWSKALFDLGHISFDEPFKKLLNQGMIQGSSRFVYRVHQTNIFLSKSIRNRIVDETGWDELAQVIDYVNSSLNYNAFEGMIGQTTEKALEFRDEEEKEDFEWSRATISNLDELRVDIRLVNGDILDKEGFRNWRKDFRDAVFVDEYESDDYLCGIVVEKMSKSKYNVVNPNDIVEKYGADTFRMYEMFLGPVEMSKPWETKGIEGVHRFLKKLWRLFADEQKGPIVTTDAPTAAELKVLHRTIKKIEDDIERFSFNTCVSAFMVCVNELAELKCHKKAILEPVLVLLTPFAPHIAEELWHLLGNESSVLDAAFPKFEAQYIAESTKEYPISVNGKLRTTLNIALDAAQPEVEQLVLQNDVVQKWLEGRQPKKIIFVKGKMVNLVV